MAFIGFFLSVKLVIARLNYSADLARMGRLVVIRLRLVYFVLVVLVSEFGQNWNHVLLQHGSVLQYDLLNVC